MAVVANLAEQELAFDGRLLRSDRSLRQGFFVLILFVIALQFGINTVPGFAVAVFAVVMLGRIAIGGARSFGEPVRLTIRERGIEFRRGNGQRLWAEWRLFEGARIERLSSVASHVLNDRWRLTLDNAFKPSIGSFVDSKAMDRTILYFPVIVDFEAQLELVDRIEAAMQRSIAIAAREKKARPLRKAVAQPLDPMALRDCMICEYPLQGLARNGMCPECGWPFEEKMFIVSTRSLGSMSMIVVAALIVGSILLTSSIIGAISVRPSWGIIWLALVALSFGAYFAIDIRRQRGAVLATAAGLELWRNGAVRKKIRWQEVTELRHARLEQGIRVGLWNSPKWRVWYSAFFGVWRTLPPGKPELDFVIDGGFDATQQVWLELAHRWQKSSPHALRRNHFTELELTIGKDGTP